MNESELRNKLISTATQYLGWSETNGQDDLIIDKYNAIRPNGGYKMGHKDSWCAAFVSVAKHEAGLDDIIPTDCSCQNMIEKFKKMGRYQEDGTITPSNGDIIFYNWNDNTQPNDGWADHVGIVVSVEGNNIKVIEGNASDKVKYRDVPIAWGYIRGYGLPDYASISTAAVAQTPIPTVSPIPTSKNYLEKGDVSNDVKIMQQMLNDCGYNCGNADGILGQRTENQLIKFQTANGLVGDGIYGQASKTKLTELNARPKIVFNQHLHDLQWSINTDKVAKLEEDGLYGNNSDNAIKHCIVKNGSRGSVVSWVQCRVGANVDGIAGKNTVQKIREYQSTHGLVADGIAGYDTIKSILRAYGVNC